MIASQSGDYIPVDGLEPGSSSGKKDVGTDFDLLIFTMGHDHQPDAVILDPVLINGVPFLVNIPVPGTGLVHYVAHLYYEDGKSQWDDLRTNKQLPQPTCIVYATSDDLANGTKGTFGGAGTHQAILNIDQCIVQQLKPRPKPGKPKLVYGMAFKERGWSGSAQQDDRFLSCFHYEDIDYSKQGSVYYAIAQEYANLLATFPEETMELLRRMQEEGG